ncbi:hypothetical protein GON09_005359 [Rhodococcus sp. B50]|nr:hypothetical protein [Rhodococcus sp. B50]
MLDQAEVWVEPDVELDPTYYERGTAARRRNHKTLEELADVYDEIEHRAEALLNELLGAMEEL